MDTAQLTADLERIGLTEYQSKAYLAAVNLGQAGLSALADEAEIPQQRIYDVVDDLAGLGLVEVHEGSSTKQAVAIPPETALNELKQRRIDELTSNFSTLTNSLQERYRHVDSSGGFITVVNHESSVHRHLRQAIQTADWWLFLSLSPDLSRSLQDDIVEAVDRGVTVRLLTQGEPGDTEADRFTGVDDLLIRHRPSADLVAAADRSYGVFRGVASASVTRPSLVTRDQTIVEMLQRYSEQFWAASRSIQSSWTYPRRYLMPWQAIGDVRGAIDAGDELGARVVGHDTTTGERDTWHGRLQGIELEASQETDFSVVLPEVARFTIAHDDHVYTVGGWDATLEDIAAHGIEIDDDLGRLVESA